MGNEAKYWFKGKILLTEDIKKKLKELLGKEIDSNTMINEPGLCIETSQGFNESYLDFIFVEGSNIAGKQDFEKFCNDYNIPIQKWMQG